MSLIAGVDEAGRGPLAGAVFAAAVILNPNSPITGLDDSKKLTAKKTRATQRANQTTRPELVYSTCKR